MSWWLLLVACGSEPQEPAEGQVILDRPADIAEVLRFLDSRPPYERPKDSGGGVPGLPDLRAATCKTCHSEFHDEWEVSVHAAAWRDKQFQAEIKKSDNRWLCRNCHTPLLSQQPLWPVGLVDDDVERPMLVRNPDYDPSFEDEGITCAACHVRNGAIHGPGESTAPAPHPVVADPAYRSGALCLSCHQAVAEYPGKSFVCTFHTGDEWSASPYVSQKNCVDCHMPRAQRVVAPGGEVRETGRHWWRGSGIPKEPGIAPPEDALPAGIVTQASCENGTLRVTATNANAGHKVPTGDPERWVQIDVSGGELQDSWRFGQVWEWWPAPRKVSDNRLAPFESRTKVWSGVEPGTYDVAMSVHRLSQENAEYHGLVGIYPTHREVSRASVTCR